MTANKHAALVPGLDRLRPGLIQEAQEFRRIGGIFYRSNRADVQNTSGFGLGLYLTSRIVRRARGRLLLEHNQQGTTTAILNLRTIG